MKLKQCIIQTLTVLKYTIEPGEKQIEPSNYYRLAFRFEGDNINVVLRKNLKSCTAATADSKEYCSGADDVIFIPANLPYLHKTLTHTEAVAIHFTAAEDIGDEIEIIKLRNAREMFGSLYKKWQADPTANSLRCMAGVYGILEAISEHTQLTREEMLLQRSVSHMYERLSDSNFRIEELHSSVHMSESYYRHVFCKAYGCSPVKFLRDIRINHAKELLKTGLYSIAETAEMSGFSSPAYFSTTFKAMEGCPPREYAAVPDSV